jgi:hypothetical protein
VVIHNISLPPGSSAGRGSTTFSWARSIPGMHPYFREIAGLKVSAHFVIRRDGTLIQYVPTDKRAWHAGVSSWKGSDRCNDFSIGVELEGADDVPFAEPQYETLARLTATCRSATERSTSPATATSPRGARPIPARGSTGSGFRASILTSSWPSWVQAADILHGKLQAAATRRRPRAPCVPRRCTRPTSTTRAGESIY